MTNIKNAFSKETSKGKNYTYEYDNVSGMVRKLCKQTQLKNCAGGGYTLYCASPIIIGKNVKIDFKLR